MHSTIYAVPISELKKIDQQLNEEFFEKLVKANPGLGTSHEKYFILNNHVNINIYTNLPQVYKNYTIFVKMAANKAIFTQLLKNQ